MDELHNAAIPDFAVTAKVNCSLSRAARLTWFLSIALISMGIALGFYFIGAWPILPFAGLEVVALGAAFYYVDCHSQDYERITILGDTLSVETLTRTTVKRFQFQRYWLQVVLRNDRYQDRLRIFLRSRGKELEVGRYMDSRERINLVRELKLRTGSEIQI